MKILQINSAHYRRGGADVVYLNSAELLQEHGHEVHFFSMEDEKNFPIDDAPYFAANNDLRNAGLARKISHAPAFIYNRDAYKKLLAFLDKTKPDVAHLHLFLGKLSSSILKALKEKNIPIVASIHDYRLLCPAYLFLDGNKKICEKCKGGFYLNCTLKRCSEGNLFQSAILTADAYFRKYKLNPLDYIDKFIFVSDFIRKKHIEFNEAYGRKEDMIYNFIPSLSNIETNFKKGKYFLFCGRLSREKGVGTLLKAAEKAGIPLKIVGTGLLHDELASKNTPNVEFVGHKNGQELWDLVRNASFMVVPSEWYENNPLTVIEAYSFGKPVIGARIGGIPEIVIDGETGYLFEAGNEKALEDVLTKAKAITEDEYTVMAKAARTFADRVFNPDDHYERLMKVYNDVIIKEKSPFKEVAV